VKSFEYIAPDSLDGAVRALSSSSQARLLAGGTDLLTQLRARRKTADLVIDVKRIPEVNSIVYDPSKGLKLGAAVPCYRIYVDPAVTRHYPALAETAALIGGIQIQGRATIGGNLCNAAPSADAIPILIALRATCRVTGPAGEREIPVEDFCVAPGKNALQPGEILVTIDIPTPAPHSGAHYLRFIPRNEMDIAVAGAGAAVTLEDGVFRSAHLALAAVAPTPVYVRSAAEWLAGKRVTDESIRTAAEMAKDAARPITDMRGTMEYRKHICGVLARRALESAVRSAREGAAA
jgi:CO/xanthine dehydrogenase FAD-binding subunit